LIIWLLVWLIILGIVIVVLSIVYFWFMRLRRLLWVRLVSVLLDVVWLFIGIGICELSMMCLDRFSVVVVR